MSEKQTIGGIAPKVVESTSTAKGKIIEKPVIRTMQKDIDSLRESGSVEPPKNLPFEKGDVKKEKTVTQEKIAKKTHEKEEKEKKTAEELREEEKKRVIQEQRKKAREFKIAAFKEWVKTNSSDLLKFSLIGIVAILILGIIGGFFYWWNYIRTVAPPIVVTHYQCRDFQCISVEGEGVDQCQTEQDCQPVEPKIPQSLIPVDETETIEIELEHKDLFIWGLELILSKNKKENALNNILVKVANQTERKYINLSNFLSFLGVGLPENIIQSAVADDLGGVNYTFFLYNQTEGERLGFIIKTIDGADLSADLKEWEASVPERINEFSVYLGDEILSTTTEEFQDNIYNDVAIRYLNLPNPDLSVDYAIIDDKLIITTSRESMYAVIDVLLSAKIEAETDEENIVPLTE